MSEGDDSILVWDGPPIGASSGVDLIAAALETGATTVAVPVDRLDPAFFDLRTGVAGELVQKAVNYGLVFAIVGSLPESASASRSFMAFVGEANRGTQIRFVDVDAARRPRVARAGRIRSHR